MASKNYPQSPHTPLRYHDRVHLARRAVFPPDRDAQLSAVKQYDQLKHAVTGDLSRLLLDFTHNKIPATTFEARMKASLRGVYRHAFRLGMQASGWPLGAEPPVDDKFLEGFKNTEWKFVRGYVADMAAGKGKLPYERRLGMYIDTISSIYDAGRIAAQPDGVTISWNLTDSEHCDDCVRLAADSPYTKETLPFQPRSGHTSCLSACKCFLEFEPPSFTTPTDPLLPPPHAPIPMQLIPELPASAPVFVLVRDEQGPLPAPLAIPVSVQLKIPEQAVTMALAEIQRNLDRAISHATSAPFPSRDYSVWLGLAAGLVLAWATKEDKQDDALAIAKRYADAGLFPVGDVRAPSALWSVVPWQGQWIARTATATVGTFASREEAFTALKKELKRQGPEEADMMANRYLVRSQDIGRGGLLKARRVSAYDRTDPRTGQRVHVGEHTDQRASAMPQGNLFVQRDTEKEEAKKEPEKELGKMTREEFTNALAQSDIKAHTTITVIDWGKPQRTNPMADITVQGKKEYHSLIGALPEEDRKEAHVHFQFNPHGLAEYARARAIGLSHDHAMLVGYEKVGEIDPGEAHRRIVSDHQSQVKKLYTKSFSGLWLFLTSALSKASVAVRAHTRTGSRGQTEQVSAYSEERKPGQVRPGGPHPFLPHPPSTAAQRGQVAGRGIKVPPVSWGLWLAKDEYAKVQATWYDKSGKKQAAYHPDFVAGQAEKKFSSLQHMQEILPKVEKQLGEDLQLDDAAPRRVAAAIVSLIHKSYIRIGSEKYAQEHETFGASSLRKEHVAVDDKGIALHFTGKHNKEQSKTVDAPELHGVLKHMQSLPGERLFQMRTKDGGLKPMMEEHVREYLAPFGLTPKSFRTYHASRLTAEGLTKLGAPASEKDAKKNIAQVVQSVSQELGNTPAVCRSSYINPAILDAYVKGELHA